MKTIISLWEYNFKINTNLTAFIKRTVLTLLIFITSIHFVYSQSDLENLSKENELRQYIAAMAPSEDAFVAVQWLAAKQIDLKNWSKAADIYRKYAASFPAKLQVFEKIIKVLESELSGIQPINLGQNVNTGNDEYFPVITLDSRIIYFTGSNRNDGYGGEDIYITKILNGVWQKAENMGTPFSTKGDDAVNSIAADNNTLVLFGNYSNNIGGGDNYYTEFSAEGWSKIHLFPKPINSIYWDCDGFLTADGKAFLFTSDRKGNIGEFQKGGIFYHGGYEGNSDIYIVIKTDSGWTEPINIGSTINTPFTERSPFLHPDGRTLYFSSDGHYGIGGMDVFKCVKTSKDSWTEWSEPVNLGKEINTSGNDIAYKITTDGKYAYFSSNRAGGFGGYDIYYISLPEEAKPENKVITVKGKITDENNKPLNADIRWFDIEQNSDIGKLSTNPITGEYIVALPFGAKYNYFAEKDGYYSVSNEIDLINEIEKTEIIIDIILLSIESLILSGQSIIINNIYFDFDKAELKPESFGELNRLNDFLTRNAYVNLEISAHTDSQGTEEYNKDLSERRAQSVVEYLMSKGISKERLKFIGYGESRPIADNETEDGRAKNRRVEMKVIN